MAENDQQPRRAAHYGTRRQGTPRQAASGQAPATQRRAAAQQPTRRADVAVPRTPRLEREEQPVRPSAARGLESGAQAPRSALHDGRLSNRSAATTNRARTNAGSSHAHPRKRTSPVLLALLGVAVVAVIALVAFVIVPRLMGPKDTRDITPGQEVTVTIPDGSGAAEVAQMLYDTGVIDSSSDFLGAIRRQGVENSLKSGAYLLYTGSDTQTVIDQLVSGPNATTSAVTIPEGQTVAQTAAIVESSLGIPASDFLDQAKASNYVADYPFLQAAADDSLEGFLFPKTYDFSAQADPTADTVIRTMLSQYQTEEAQLDLSAAAANVSARYGLDIDEYDLVTIASIIEREAGTAEDRDKVASVFYNRLVAGMPLQSDATMTYVTGGEVTADDLKTESPYNTYLNSGLTPTPICNPGAEALQAACNPADTSYYYFYLSEGYSAFSSTYEEHQQAIANAPAN